VAKIMVSISDELLARLDEEAARRSVTRSALLAQAVRRELDRPNAAALDAAIERSRRRFASAGSFEAADLIRRERERP
jgi:metal-responsive CopG/Arc/MetJ family transcriptional regulator